MSQPAALYTPPELLRHIESSPCACLSYRRLSWVAFQLCDEYRLMDLYACVSGSVWALYRCDIIIVSRRYYGNP